MLEFDQSTVEGATFHDAPLRVNRAVIQLGSSRQLVYYWFQQRGRNITNEFLVKWYLLWDSLLRNRSDGALVRLVTPMAENEEPAAAEQRLSEFTRALIPLLGRYVPE
jgi:EpsI family protein